MTDFLLLPLSERIKEFNRISAKYPEMVPIIMYPVDKLSPPIEKRKFLAKREMTVGDLLIYIKSKIKLNPSEALFIFIDDKLVNGSQLLIELHKKYPAKDGFLYVKYGVENTFG